MSAPGYLIDRKVRYETSSIKLTKNVNSMGLKAEYTNFKYIKN